MQPFFYILIRGRNCMPYVLKCLESVNAQEYKNFTTIFIDDASDYTSEEKKNIRQMLPKGCIEIWRNNRYYSLRNAHDAVHTFCKDPDGIVVSLDADDYLLSSKSLAILSATYEQSACLYTYGNCLVLDPSQPNLINAQSDGMHNTEYPPFVIDVRSFRDYHFLPLHLRSWKVWAFKKILKRSFLTKKNTWLRHCEDMAIFFPLLEMFPNRCRVIDEPLAVYRKDYVGSEIANNMIDVLRDELYIRGQKKYEKKRI